MATRPCDHGPMTDALAGLARTAVPLLVGWLLGFPAVRALGLTEEQVTPLVSAFVGLAWWLAVRGLETWVTPHAGWLLGYARAPRYVDSP